AARLLRPMVRAPTSRCSLFFFFSSRRRHTRWPRDWSSDVCSSDLSPSLEGTLADSLISCVRIDISLLDLNGYTRCTPSDSTSPRSEERRVGKECRSRWSPDQ